MSVDTFIARMRAKEQKTWRSEGTLTRASGGSTFNEATGEVIDDSPATIYEGICDVRAAGTSGRRRDAEVAEKEIRISALKGKFPADTPAQVNDWLTVSASSYDAGLVGRAFRVTDVIWDDWQIARVVLLEEVTS